MQNKMIEGFRLSPLQRQLWRGQQGRTAFRAQCLVTLDGALDACVLERGLAAVVGHHEILRTTFDCLPGMETPLQVIAEAPGLSFETVDLTGLDGRARDEAVGRFFREEAGRPFDFASGPLAHFKLLKLAADKHALLVSLPAMCADSRTLKNLVGELSQVYATLLEGGEPAADDEALQYVQFSEWHNEILEGEEADAGRAFWEAQRLADIRTPALPLEEASRPDAAADGFAPEVFASEVDADLARRVEGVAERLNVSSEALLLACWQLLLWRLGGGDGEAVVVESLFGGRKYEELSGALGLFANYLPVPLRVDARAPFSELARRAEQSVSDASARQEYYTRESAGGLDPARSIKFEYDTQPEGEQGGGVKFALARQYVCLDRFKLKLCVTDTLGSLLLELHYDPASVGEGAVRRLAGAFRALVRGVADDPETAARDLNVLGEDERRQVLFDWNQTRADYRADICLHQLFEEQAARTPDATAVVFEESRLTFAELNGRANQLARGLRGLGVGPEVRVGLCMSRSAEMLVGLLGILKAGGAYLPLDPAYPAERLAFMLEDGRAEVLLTQEGLLSSLPSYAGRVVCVDRDAETLAGESAENLAPSAAPDNLAYVIYTSGSTGRPKGVMIRHRSVLNLVAALDGAIYDRHPSPLRVSVNAPLAFDGSVKQLVQVAKGHALYVVPEEIRPDGAAMLSFIERHRLDVLDCTPSQLRLLLDAGMHERPGCAPALALVGGEALDQTTWDALAASPSTVYYNVYGPTECTVDATVARVGAGQTRPNIGRPIANVEVYILDDALRPVSVGVAGELYVGGGGVARGYLGRAALTAERFVPHPFSAEAGSRLYRTGDLARWREDGTVEFIGRADNQVKVRGLRIELGEIESVIARHPAVGEVAVLAREDTPGDQRLVAYVVPGRGHAAGAEGPQRYRLPNGMAIAHHNAVETNYIYREIFEDRAYMKHGIRLPPGACVFDVGANVGLFTLFVTRNCPGARVYAFEPIGPIFDNLRANCGLYSRDAKLFDYGLSHEEATASFTYYPEYSTRSGLTSYADASDEVDVIKKFLQNKQEGGDAEVGGLLSEADDLFAGFFNGSTEECRLRRLSDVIREQGVGRIDLLKVDVQRAELDVLRGVDEDDWDKIDQVVMEVHDADGQETQGRVGEILGLLKRQGFEAVAEQDELLRHTDRYNIYAVRQGLAAVEVSDDGLPQSEYAPAHAEAPSDFEEPSTLSGNELREYVRGKLPDYMVPSAFVVLDSLPLNRNGKVDRRALPAPSVSSESAASSEAPSGWYEEVLAGLWEEVLRAEGVGRGSNFFELGGHSLLATQLVLRVREAFGVELPLRALFESPTVAGLASRVAEARGTGTTAPAVVAGNGSGELSFAQQRLWFLHQLEPDNPFYNCPGAVRLSGSLNFGALEQTINEVVRRHEVLRSTFRTVDGEPVQNVTAFKPFNLPLTDLSALPEQAREEEVRCLAKAEAQRPFDLARGPVLRVELLRLAADQHILLFTMHHIVADGWSMGILLREVSALYNAFSKGEESPLAELPVQYADYAAWQRQWLQGEVLESHLSYWREQLSGAPPLLELPTDRPRPAVQTYRGAAHSFALPAELTRRLKELSRREGVTLFMTLLAAFDVLLARYTGQSDISVGTDVAGRDRAETEGLIGFFVNALVLRTRVEGAESFGDLLRRVREVCLGAYQHQEMPFERLVEELNPERSLSHSPLFQVSFDMDYGRSEALELGGLSAGGAGGGGGARWSKFDLTLGVAESGGSARAAFEYNTDLFDAATVERMASHLLTLLDAIARDPGQGVAELPMMSGEEANRLLLDFNDTAADYPRDICLHQLFEAQAARTPDAEAVVFGRRRLTYAELDARANQLAHHLRSLGVGRESLVAVLLERSEQMVVAVLAVMKAGGAYVPLDPSYPRERLRFMLEDSGARVLVTQKSLAELLDANGVKAVYVDADSTVISSYDSAAPSCAATPDNLAYAIYTSGSTGRPKGSLVSHSALVNYALMMRSRLGLDDSDRFLQFASFSFDVFVEEVFPALSAGARIVMGEAEEMLTAAGLSALMEREGVTACELPAAYWQEWVRWMSEGGTVPPTSLRAVLVGCEKPSPERVGQWAGFGVRLVQVFGLTETAITTTLFEPREEATGEWRWQAGRELPIGRPVENARVYVLDALMRPVPVGVSGELYIGGDGLGRGYLNRAALTAERFVPDPFGAEGGGRLYKTGDVVRHLACGELELLGRLDEQVKVRGFRVELGEIEAALQSHACVRECTVMARDSGRGDKRLVAYFVAEGDGAGAAELRAHLKGRLPEYMVPSAFVTLEALPLTANGKIDRRALPEPSGTEKGVAADYVAAATPVEEVLAGVWSQLLGAERVGANDNFFELGGHSLLATQLVSRVREAFGVEVPLRAVFESPTVAELAACVERMTDACGEKQSAHVTAVPRGEGLRLSFAQERLWFLDQLEPDSPFYNVASAVRLDGPLDLHALERTLSEVVRRHEVLRTSFEMVGGSPVQRVSAPEPLGLPLVDLSALPEAERVAEARRLSGEESRLPFDLSEGPMLRALLVKLAEEDHVLALTMHHIVSDAWSINILVREVTTLYSAYSRGERSPLPEPQVQYADFAHWQRGWLQGEVLEAQLDYWRERLAGAPPVLELPTDRPRPAVQTYNGAIHIFSLSPELTRALNDLGRREGATLFMTLLAGFQALMHRYTHQDDIVVGTPIAGRNRLETEDLIGFFVNTLVLRTRLSGRTTFRGLLKEVREVTLGAYQHQDVPFEKLVEELQPERDLSRQPLFQVMFSLTQNASAGGEEPAGIKLSPFGADNSAARFDITLEMNEFGGRLGGGLRYNVDLFDEGTIRRMVEHFTRLLEAAASNPEESLSELPLLGEAERRQLLEGWNDTATGYPRDFSVHELFEEQALRTPDGVALACGELSLTYRQLDERSNQLARYLRRMGVGPEVRVGVCLPRSVELVMSLLAVLKAGGVYVPLDPTYPLERLAVMLEDARSPVLVTDEEGLDSLPSQWGQVVCVDSDWEAISRELKGPIGDTGVSEDNLAYVIYTSGSTGRPKGVAVTHKGITRLVKSTNYVELTPSNKVAQVSNTSFDAATFELWGSLLNGGQLVLVSRDASLSAREMVEQIREQGISTMFLTTALFNQMARETPHAFDTMREVLFGGEAVDVRWVREVLRAGGPRRLLHVYGPTESTTFATWHEVREVGDDAVTVPIGRPLSNTTAYVLDAGMRPVPVGVSGELYIGGDGLARGYLNQAGLTAERFVPDPSGGVGGGRLYKTGDVVRQLPDGGIEFIGRADYQVKVRGFRIELGEIESALQSHTGVSECVVVARESEGGDKRLVAYVVVREGAGDAGAAELRAHLKERLPEYMVPSAFVTLEAMPLTPNGKIDRRALPEPGAVREACEEQASARTPVEEVLAGIWSQLLGLEGVGVNENFFELGGHSLLATQLVSRMREAFGVDVPLRTAFECPTIAELAEAVETAIRAEDGIELSPIVSAPRELPLPLSFSQQRLWFIDRFEPGTAAYNVPAAVRLRGRLDVDALERTFGELLRRHESLRTTFAEVDGQPVQVIRPSGPLRLPVTDLRGLPEEEREGEARRLATEEARLPFDLAQGPLLRAGLIRLGDEDHVVLFTMHHIVSDGWSIGVLVREIAALYAAFTKGEESPLSELPIQYADFAVWQREWLQGEVLEAELRYWKQHLSGAPALLRLPTDRPRPAVQGYSGASQPFMLPEELAAKLKRLCRAEGVTLYMTLLAAFKTLLYRHSGERDIVIGTPIAGRNRTDIEGLIGFFVNTLVIRTKLSAELTFVELLRNVREATLGAYAHQDLPFEKLVEELQPERDMGHTPLFQVMFVLQNAPREAEELPDLKMTNFVSQETTAKFDLTISMVESGERVGGTLEYNTDLFDDSTAARLLRHFAKLLESIASRPEVLLAELELLSEEENELLAKATDVEELGESFSF